MVEKVERTTESQQDGMQGKCVLPAKQITFYGLRKLKAPVSTSYREKSTLYPSKSTRKTKKNQLFKCPLPFPSIFM